MGPTAKVLYHQFELKISSFHIPWHHHLLQRNLDANEDGREKGDEPEDKDKPKLDIKNIKWSGK